MELSQVRWACRRGMLELDLFLLPFCERYYAALSMEEQNLFKALLESPDPDLFQWLMQQAEAPVGYQALIQHIIQAKRAATKAGALGPASSES